MNIEAAENSILTKLSTDLGSTFETELLPEKQADFEQPFEKTKVSICYAMSAYDKPKSAGLTVQQEDASFQLVIAGRKLRGSGGIYDAFRLVTNSLLGFMPTNCRRIFAVKFEFEKRENGVFSYIYTVSCGSELVMDYTESGPNLNDMTFTPPDPGFTGITVQ